MTMCSEQYIRILGCFPKCSNMNVYDIKSAIYLAGFEVTENFGHTTNEILSGLWNDLDKYFYGRYLDGLNIDIVIILLLFEYERCGTEKDKNEAEVRFLHNMLRWIDIHTKKEKLKNIRYVSSSQLFVFINDVDESFFNHL